MNLCSQLHFPLMMPWMWGLLTVVIIIFYFILVSFCLNQTFQQCQVKVRLNEISVSVPKAGGVRWTAQSEDGFHTHSLYNWLESCQVLTGASPGCLFLHLRWNWFLLLLFLYSPPSFYLEVLIFPSSGNVAQQLKGTSSPRSESSVIMFSNSDADIKSGEVS